MRDARNVIASVRYGYRNDPDYGQFFKIIGPETADAILFALHVAGYNVLGREPTGEMCQAAMEHAVTEENNGLEFAPYVAWTAMWDVAHTKPKETP